MKQGTAPFAVDQLYHQVALECYKLVFLTLLQRERSAPKLSFDESERRALLVKEWSRYKQVNTYYHTSFTTAFVENVASGP